MRFGPLSIDDARGAILAHAVRTANRRWPKAHRIDDDDIEAMRGEGVTSVIAALLDPGDVEEDAAATQLAHALRVDHVTVKPAATGRVNLHAREAGLFRVDRERIDAINAVDPTLTLATLADMERVEAGQMVATVKIIPFAVAQSVLQAAQDEASGVVALRVEPFKARRVGLIQSELAGVKPSVLDKTARMTAARLERSGSHIVEERRCAHDTAAIRRALEALVPSCDLVIVFGASAMSDPGDVIPAAIEEAGGRVDRVGMPVDPGNLLILGSLDGRPVIGAPGCARSPKENGFDWVLDRLMAGMAVTGDDIARMGVGGLLSEIASRPQPREKPSHKLRLGGVLLAAGSARRMGSNKLLARFDAKPLVRRIAEQLGSAGLDRLVAVTGHQGDAVSAALDGLPLQILCNRDHDSGLASSLKTGLHAMRDLDGALIMLGDMPRITTDHLKLLVQAFIKARGLAVVRAAAGGRAGNPVILPRSLFDAVNRLDGDRGARALIEASDIEIVDVDIGQAALADIDTPDALAREGGKPPENG